MLAVAIFGSGCCSYAVLKDSQKKIAYRRAVAEGNDVAIKAIPMGDGVGLGIDISNIDALTEQPFMQLGAAILDLLIVYGGYEALNNDGGSKDDQGGIQLTVNGNENSVDLMTINGDNNDGNAGGDSDNDTNFDNNIDNSEETN